MVLRPPAAPRWAWIAMAFGVAALALLLPRVFAATAPSPGSDAAPAARSSSAPDLAQSLLVVGDGWTATADDEPSTGWPAALSRELAATGIEVRTMVSAATGAG